MRPTTLTPLRSVVWPRRGPRCERERLLVRLAEWLDAGRLEALDDVRARLRATRRADLPAFHVVGRQDLEIAQQLRRVDQLLRLLTAGTLGQRRARTASDENDEARDDCTRVFSCAYLASSFRPALRLSKFRIALKTSAVAADVLPRQIGLFANSTTWPLLDRHVDDDRPLRDVAAALQQAGHEQLVLIGEPQRPRAAADRGGMMLSGVRNCRRSAARTATAAASAGAAGRCVSRIQLRHALRLIRIVGRAAAGGARAPPAARRRRAPPPAAAPCAHAEAAAAVAVDREVVGHAVDERAGVVDERVSGAASRRRAMPVPAC